MGPSGMLRVNLLCVDTIHSQKNKFVTGVWEDQGYAGWIKTCDSPVLFHKSSYHIHLQLLRNNSPAMREPVTDIRRLQWRIQNEIQLKCTRVSYGDFSYGHCDQCGKKKKRSVIVADAKVNHWLSIDRSHRCVRDCSDHTLLFFSVKNIVFPVQGWISYFSEDFRLNISSCEYS